MGVILTKNYGGVSDHGSLNGLGDDDHPQYLTIPRGDIRYYTQDQVNTISGSLQNSIDNITVSGGIADHGMLEGLDDDDHTQYFNISRGDARYYTESEVDALIASVSGTTDHSVLSNLDYENSGHTGFVSTAQLTTISGDIVLQIPTDYYTQSQVNIISGALSNEIDVDISIHEAGSSHDSRYYTEAEVDVLIAGVSGTTDHSLLTNLDYASSGHTGFQPAGNYVITSELTTVSGDIIDQIPSLVGYATESYVHTISGTLSNEIDLDITVHAAGGDHDSRYYTEAEVDVLIASASGTTDHSLLDNLDYVSSGHTGFQPSGNYATNSEVVTLSGNLQNQIDNKSDVSHIHDDRYYTEDEVTTISGDIVAQIPVDYYTQSDVDTISGVLSAEIDSDIFSHSTDSSAHHVRYTDEEAQDAVGQIIVGAGTVVVNYDDDANVITISGATSSGGGVPTDHASLLNLGYASSGHTGFAATIHYHDDRYYTEDEITTISGDIISQIPVDYYTQSEVDTISGVLSTEIDDDITLHSANSSAHHTRYTDEEAQDAVGNIMLGTGSVVVTYNDIPNTITISGSTVSGISDHGSLTGLSDDDHAQYLLVDGSRGITSTISGVDPIESYHIATKNYVDIEIASISGGGGTSDHGALTGLEDDDHSQYHNNTRGDARYYIQSQVDTISGVLSTEIDSDISTHEVGSSHDSRYYTEGEITTISGDIISQIITDHGNLSGLSDDDHTQYILVNGSRDFTGSVNIDTISGAHEYKIGGSRAIAMPITDTNLVLGYQAGGSLAAGSTNNVFIGCESGKLSTTAYDNVAVGYRALYNNTDGYYNFGFGSYSLFFNTTGYYNLAIGNDALRSNVGGYLNVALGPEALKQNTSGHHNFAIGGQSLRLNTEGVYNTAIGANSLYGNLTGDYNVAIGPLSLRYGTTGDHNIGIGMYSGYRNTTGIGNISFGYRSGYNQQQGSYNTFIGYESGYGTSVSNYSYNVGIGYRTLNVIYTGGYNICIGYKVGDIITTGSRNIIIGYDIDPSSATVDDELNIGGTIYGDMSNKKIGIGAVPLTNECDLGCLSSGVLAFKEAIITPLADVGYAKIYWKNDKFYFQDGSGDEHEMTTDTFITTVSGDIVAQIPTRYTDEEAQDAVGQIMVGAGTVVVNYDDDANTITISGATTSGGGSPTDHASLLNLDYASSGHTGFAPITHYHDDRYYTESEVDTISGALSSEIDSDISIHEAGSSHDSRYYTESEIDSMIATLSGSMDDHNELNNIQGGAANDYYHLTSAQHTDLTDGNDCSSHKHDDRYYTESEVDTISGALSAEIDSDITIHEAGSSHDSRYYTESEVDTISGSLSNEIDSDVSTHEAGSSHDSRYYTESEIDTWRNSVTQTEMGYLHGVTSDVQTQLDDMISSSEMTTISGDISSEIDGDISTHEAGSSHDSRYYTESELDGGQLDNRYYTESEINVISGSLQAGINDKDNYSSWSFAVDGVTKDELTSGDVLNFVGGDNITIVRSAEDEITISGSSGGGSSDHGALTGLGDDDHSQYHNNTRGDARYYTQAQVDSISGSLSSEIDLDISTFSGTIDHNTLVNYDSDRHFLKSEIDEVGTISSGVWQGSSISTDHTDAKCTATWPNTYSANQDLNTNSNVSFNQIAAASTIISQSYIQGDYLILKDNYGIGSYNFTIAVTDTFSTSRHLDIDLDDGNRVFNLYGDLTVEAASLINQDLTTDASPTFAGLTMADGGTIGQAAGPLLTFNDTDNYLTISGCNIGIGTTTPTSKVHITSTDLMPLGVYANQTANWIADFYQDHATGYGVQIRSDATTDVPLLCATNGNDDYVLAVKADGQVGIGTATPSASLEVNADVATDWSAYIFQDNSSGYGLKVKTDATTSIPIFYAVNGNDADNFVVQADGLVCIGDSSNSKMTRGLTINQGSLAEEILALKASEVAHGVTALTETDTFCCFKKYGNDGGAHIFGVTENVAGLLLQGVATYDNVDKDATAIAPVVINAVKKSGTTYGAVGADGNLLVITNDLVTKFIVDEDGDIHYDGVDQGSYDNYTDGLVCQDLNKVLSNRYNEVMEYSKDKLVEMGVISKEGFISNKRHNMLMLGTAAEYYQMFNFILDKLGYTYSEVIEKIKK